MVKHSDTNKERGNERYFCGLRLKVWEVSWFQFTRHSKNLAARWVYMQNEQQIVNSLIIHCNDLALGKPHPQAGPALLRCGVKGRREKAKRHHCWGFFCSLGLKLAPDPFEDMLVCGMINSCWKQQKDSWVKKEFGNFSVFEQQTETHPWRVVARKGTSSKLWYIVN